MNARLVILSLIVCAGCAETRPDQTEQQELQAAPVELPAPVEQPSSNERERRLKRAENGPQGPNADVVDWGEAAQFRQLDSTPLPEKQRAKLVEVKVPVLAFDDAALLSSALLTHHSNWYVIAVESTDGLNMNVRGTRNSWTAPQMELSEAARKAAENYTLGRTHGVVTVSWRAFGASYSLDIECARPLADTRCTEDDFALRTAEALGVVGGQP